MYRFFGIYTKYAKNDVLLAFIKVIFNLKNKTLIIIKKERSFDCHKFSMLSIYAN